MHFSSVFTREDTCSLPVPETKLNEPEGGRLGQLVVTPEVVASKINNMKENKLPWAKTIKKNTNSTQNKSQTHRAKQYEVTSFLSTDCELSTDTCSKNVYSLGPRSRWDIT